MNNDSQKRKRPIYSKEFKRDAVALVTGHGDKVTEGGLAWKARGNIVLIPPQEMSLRRYLKALYNELSPENLATGICVQKALSSVVIAYGDS